MAEQAHCTDFTRHGNTNWAGTVVRFPRDDQFRLVTACDYKGKGLLKSVNVSGSKVESHRTTVPGMAAVAKGHTGFDHDRYPGSVRNPLGHIESFDYDPGFDLLISYSDANSRVMRAVTAEAIFPISAEVKVSG